MHDLDAGYCTPTTGTAVGEYTRARYRPMRLRTSIEGPPLLDYPCPACGRAMERHEVQWRRRLEDPPQARVLWRCGRGQIVGSTQTGRCGYGHYEDESEEMVARLTQEVRGGTYQVDAEATAEAMLRRAAEGRLNRPRRQREEETEMPRGGKRKYTDEQIAEAARLMREESLTQKEAAERVGMRKTALQWHLQRAERAERADGAAACGPEARAQTRAAIAERVRAGESVASIMRAVGVGGALVREVRRKMEEQREAVPTERRERRAVIMCGQDATTGEPYQERGYTDEPPPPQEPPPEPVHVVALDAASGRQIAPPIPLPTVSRTAHPARECPWLRRAITDLRQMPVGEYLRHPEAVRAAIDVLAGLEVLA